jgi:ketosteroid isomerase-like protein
MLMLRKTDNLCGPENADFLVFIDRLDLAQRAFAQGRPDEFKKLWSHTEEVTLVGGHGGRTACGWESVSARLDWASSTYCHADRETEFISGCVSGDFAYLVRNEIIEAQIGSEPVRRKQALRVTMVFRHQADGWRIVHRHADSQIESEI